LSTSSSSTKSGLAGLTLAAVGVVYGDIGTSPLYALKEVFAHGHVALTAENICGVLSLVFWTLTVVVSIKYVVLILRADNNGEGGLIAMLALASQAVKDRPLLRRRLLLLGIFGTAIFFGDGVITPAISVLSAVEGLEVATPALQRYVVPLTLVVLTALFMVQRHGTANVGRFFGPVMVVWFVVLAVLGLQHIAQNPSILWALSPHFALVFLLGNPGVAFIALGSVVLCVTGAEALYADMGHFGARPIRVSWLWIVLPALVCNYLGQASLLMRMGEPALVSPFYLLAPDWFQWPLLIIASGAAVIASQAVITGAFSVTQQAIQLGFIPRMSIKHTSLAQGQIYIPVINTALMIAVIVLVLVFQRSANLTAAYGIAVTGAMTIDNVLLAVVLFNMWKWKKWFSVPLLTLFFSLDAAYLLANFTKIPDGGWVPLAMGLIIFTLLTTWSRGRMLMHQSMAEGTIPMEVFAKSAHSSAARVAGTAVFMASNKAGVPSALLHNIKHNKVLHERVVILTIAIQDVPYVDEEKRFKVADLGQGFYRLVIKFGFLEETDVPAALKRVSLCGAPFEMMKTSFFLSRQTLIASAKPGMWIWREKLFAWMLRNAASAMEFFRLPTNRVVELGSQVEI
jgi:KUP system potassium uptake protein